MATGNIPTSNTSQEYPPMPHLICDHCKQPFDFGEGQTTENSYVCGSCIRKANTPPEPEPDLELDAPATVCIVW